MWQNFLQKRLHLLCAISWSNILMKNYFLQVQIRWERGKEWFQTVFDVCSGFGLESAGQNHEVRSAGRPYGHKNDGAQLWFRDKVKFFTSLKSNRNFYLSNVECDDWGIRQPQYNTRPRTSYGSSPLSGILSGIFRSRNFAVRQSVSWSETTSLSLEC